MRLALTLACILSAQMACAEQTGQIALPGGASVAIPDTALTLVLTNVTDQRCPAGVDCFWEGMMRVEITVTTGIRAATTFTLCNLCDGATRSTSISGSKRCGRV